MILSKECCLSRVLKEISLITVGPEDLVNRLIEDRTAGD